MIALLILLIGLTPSLLSWLLMRRVDARAQARLQLVLNTVASRGLPDLRLDPDHHFIEGIGYVIGDISCQFNARSGYLRCAVNPTGPCRGCRYYEPTRDWEAQDTL
jgi:hypothetical protein